MDKVFEEVVNNIATNHRKIIDDWCKSYLAQLHEEGVDIKPGCFTLCEQVPTMHNNNFVKKYWFEPGVPEFPERGLMDKWINIKERLPDLKNYRVLVYAPLGLYENDLGMPSIDAIYWYKTNFGEYHKEHLEKITHWIEIPELPVELEESNA